MKKVVVYSILFVLTLQLKAQNNAQSRADQLYKTYAYSEAVEGYLKLLKRNPDNEYYIQQIAYCYQKMGQYQQALAYYEKHVQSKRARYEDQFDYGMLLLTDQQFEKAIEQFKKCMVLNPNDQRSAAQIDRIQNFEKLNLLHLVDTVFCAPFNTRFADMSPAFFRDSIAFVSARDSSTGNTYSWNNQPFLDIYQFGTNKAGRSEIQKIPGVNTKFHEGPMVFTHNDETIWFTRNNQKTSNASGEQTNNLRIYEAVWDGEKWSNLQDFQHNSNNYSVGHPAFSPDGNTMYFASNMPGTVGETDLFRVKKTQVENRKGKLETIWSQPENMGSQFNTIGKEMFPFVDERGVLFFASDGFPGFGGLDIFAAFPVADSFNVINLGQPINSTYDDFSFIVKNNFTEGYFTSNRPGGTGSDDIYSFHIGMQQLLINVKSLKNNQPLSDVNISYSVNGERKTVGTTDEKGSIWIDVDFHSNYYIEASHGRFLRNSDSLMAYEIFKISDHSKTIYLDEATQLQVLSLNEENEDPVGGVSVLFIFPDGKVVEKLTDGTGKASITLDHTGIYEIEWQKKGYIKEREKVVVDQIDQSNYSITKQMVPVYAGKTIMLNNLYYDVNSSLIRPDAALVLDELFAFLENSPEMKIELGSHTDCRADADYNLWLSQKRAQSAVDYLVSKGIAEHRIKAVGYGESKLLNQCADGVECSDEEHQMNRRTEIKILEF